MAYLVLAYPVISPVDYQFIQAYRAANDELYFKVVEPHFTIVFPVFELPEAEFIREAQRLSAGCKPFDFEIKCAVVNRDAFQNYYHELLVPDRGFSDFVKLHDRMYSGSLASNLRLDIDFIPHIGIGNTPDPAECKRRVDVLNARGIHISGRIESLDVVFYENDMVHTLRHIHL